MELLFLGLAFGVVTVMAPGPVSMSLIQVASIQGRLAGTKAAVGIATGDMILATFGVGLISAGTRLPSIVFDRIQLVSGVMLIVFGVAMFARPSAVQSKAAGVSRPARSFLALTILLPSTLGSWLALLAAMPFAAEPSRLGLFAAGVVTSSILWHPVLGIGAGAIGPRLNKQVLTIVTRLGGIGTASLGLWSLV